MKPKKVTKSLKHGDFKKTKIGEIPKSWELRRVEEVCTSLSGGTPSRANNEFFEGSIPWIKSTEVGQGHIYEAGEKISQEGLENSSAKWVPPEATLIAMYGATAGKVGLLKIRATTNQAVVALIPNTVLIDSMYLYQYMLSIRKALTRFVQGSGQPNLSQTIIRKLQIPIPPMKEQEGIGSILNTADMLISLERQIVTEIAELKKGLMQHLLTRGIGHTRFKKTKIGEIPESWFLKKVGEVCTTYSGGTPRRSNKIYFDGGVIPWIKSSEVGKGLIHESEEMITQEGVDNSSAKWVPPDSTLVAMYGATAGEVGILKIRATTNQALVALIPDRSKMDSMFLYQCMLYQKGELTGFVQGSGQPNISQSIDRKLRIPIPPKEEQERIGSILYSVDKIIAQKKASREKLTEMKKGLMQVLLTGKVRVKV